MGIDKRKAIRHAYRIPEATLFLIALIGGSIGIILGIFISYALCTILNWPFVVSKAAIGVSFAVCAATGMFFGWYPARKAANLDPITALRYE